MQNTIKASNEKEVLWNDFVKEGINEKVPETVEHEKEVLSAAIRRGEDISDIYEERFTGFSSVRNRIYREMKYEGYSDDAIERAIKRAMDALHKSL